MKCTFKITTLSRKKHLLLESLDILLIFFMGGLLGMLIVFDQLLGVICLGIYYFSRELTKNIQNHIKNKGAEIIEFNSLEEFYTHMEKIKSIEKE